MVLSPDDAKDFFRLLSSLMGFLLAPRGKRKGNRSAADYKKLSIEDRFDLHRRFAENASREVEAYLSTNPDHLPAADLAEIAAWKDAVSGKFIFLRQLKNHHVMIELSEKPRVLLVSGLNQPIQEVLRQPLPAIGETTLLPFRGKIVCDGVISSPRIAIGNQLRKNYNAFYQTAKKKGELISELGVPPGPRKTPAAKKASAKKPANPLQRLIASVAKRLREYREERAILKKFEDEVVPAFQTWVETRFKKERAEAFALQNEIDDLQETIFRLNEGTAGGVDEVLAGVREERETMETARAEGAPMPPPPEEMMEAMFDEFLEQTRGLSPWDLEAEEYDEAYAGFRESFKHAADGNKAAFERSLMGLLTDRSPDHVKRVNSAYRRVAKMLHPDKHSDHDDDTKELWELLREAKEVNDLETIERIEIEWRLLRSAAFTDDETPRLKHLQYQLKEDFRDLRFMRERLTTHPMWGVASPKPTKAVEKIVKAGITDEIRELQFLKKMMEARLAALHRMPRQNAIRKSATKKKATPKKAAAKKSDPKKSAPEPGDEQLDFGF